MSLQITVCHSEEYQSLFEIYQKVIISEWHSKQNLQDLWNEFQFDLQEEEFFLIKKNEQILGFISFFAPDAFIHHFYIKEEHRNDGLGKKLLKFVCNKLRHPIRLKCLKNNKNALLFYDNLGWLKVAEGESEEGDFYLLEYTSIESERIKMSDFGIHEKLLEDTYRIGKMVFTHVLLMKNAEVPWFILVPETKQIEIHALEPEKQIQLTQETSEVARFVKKILVTDKINIGAIGNIVPQMHIHIIGRRINDYCWPNVVWGQKWQKTYTEAEVLQMKSLIKSSLGAKLTMN